MKHFKNSTILAFLSLFCLTIASCQSLKEDKISVEEFYENWQEKDITLLDVRTEAEFSKGYIKNAQLIPINSSNFEAQINQLPKEKTTVVYCHSDTRALKAIEILKQNGFDSLYLMQGSIVAWQEKGYPLEK